MSQNIDTDDSWNESEEFKKILINLREIYKPLKNFFDSFLEIKPGLVDSLEKLDSVLKKKPDLNFIIPEIDNIQKNSELFLTTAKKQRVEKFGYVESEFVNTYRQTGKEIGDTGKGWNLGLFELELNREAGTARCLYSDEPLGKWEKVSSAGDIEKIVQNGINNLEQTRLFIPDEKIVDIFWNTYWSLANSEKKRDTSENPRIFLYPDFFRELRIEAFRSHLSGKNPEIHIKSTDLSKVGFIYAIDRYRLVSDGATDKRLTIEVATVAELKHAVKSRRIDMNDSGTMYSKIYFR